MDDLLIKSEAGAGRAVGGGGRVELTGCSHADQHGGEVEGPC